MLLPSKDTSPNVIVTVFNTPVNLLMGMPTGKCHQEHCHVTSIKTLQVDLIFFEGHQNQEAARSQMIVINIF